MSLKEKKEQSESTQNTACKPQQPVRQGKVSHGYTQPAFMICVAVLAFFSVYIKHSGKYVEKEFLPLTKQFNLLNENDLAPYKVLRKSVIENEDEIKSLGTEDYLQWILEDTSVAKASPVRICSLLITYYGLSDKIPHVPEECYIGSGYQQELSGKVAFNVNKDSAIQQVPGKYILFSNPNADFMTAGSKFYVLYTFNVNGLYANDRSSVRIILMKNLKSKYSYFSKVEWSFRYGRPNKDEVVKASEKLLAVLLPLLEDQHWPDLKK